MTIYDIYKTVFQELHKVFYTGINPCDVSVAPTFFRDFIAHQTTLQLLLEDLQDNQGCSSCQIIV